MANSRKPLSAPDQTAQGIVFNALTDGLAALTPANPGRASGPPATVLVALSGGLDSMVLADAAQQVLAATTTRLIACHIHHGLSPYADAWRAHCAHWCAVRHIPFEWQAVTVAHAAGKGLEAAAREVRYQALIRLAVQHGATAILLGHHSDDQAETVMLQLLRGTGLRGLAAMPQQRRLDAAQLASPDAAPLCLLRPLLNVPRAVLSDYAAARGLDWVDDESNDDLRYARNALRHDVFPAIERHFPEYRQTLARAARHAADAQDLCDELAGDDLSQVALANATRPDVAPVQSQVLSRSALRALSDQRLRNLLRFWMRREGLRAASEARLRDIVVQLRERRVAAGLSDRSSSTSRIAVHHDAHVLVGYRDAVYWCPVRQAIPADPADSDTSAIQDARDTDAPAGVFAADGPGIWRLPQWGGALQRFDVAGADRVDGKMRIQIPPIALEMHVLRVARRQGGERLRLGAQRPTRSLKQHFQDAGVPPQQRQQPLFYLDDQLFFVPFLGGYATVQGTGARGTDAGDRVGLEWVPDEPPLTR